MLEVVNRQLKKLLYNIRPVADVAERAVCGREGVLGQKHLKLVVRNNQLQLLL